MKTSIIEESHNRPKNMRTEFRFKLIREIRSTLFTLYKNTHSL